MRMNVALPSQRTTTTHTIAAILVALLLVAGSGILPHLAQAQQIGGTQKDCYGDYKNAMLFIAGEYLKTVRTYEEMSYWQRTFNPMIIGAAELATAQYYAQAYSAYWQFISCSAIPVK